MFMSGFLFTKTPFIQEKRIKQVALPSFLDALGKKNLMNQIDQLAHSEKGG